MRPKMQATLKPPRHTPLYCSFCGKAEHEVRRLIAGPGWVFICNECISLCGDIIAQECHGSREMVEADIQLPAPGEGRET